MGQSHKAPGGETLRQRELHHYPALLVSRQLRIEESGLVQVLTHLHLFLLLLCGLGLSGLSLCFFCDSIGGISHGHCCVSVFNHSGSRLHHSTSSCFLQHRPAGVTTEAITIIGRIDTIVKRTEHEILDLFTTPRMGGTLYQSGTTRRSP